MFSCIYFQAKGVTIIGIGFGRKIDINTMKQLAGTKGHSFLVSRVADPYKIISLIVSAACGNTYLLIFSNFLYFFNTPVMRISGFRN